jgi:hypothetical protein
MEKGKIRLVVLVDVMHNDDTCAKGERLKLVAKTKLRNCFMMVVLITIEIIVR